MHNPAWYFIYLVQMDRANVLSFSPVSKRFTLCVCGVTRSLEMALAPSSQGRNHLVEWQTHTYTRTRTCTQHREAGRIWIALRQTFLTHKFFIPPTAPYFALNVHLHTYKGTRTEIPFCQLSAPDHVTIKDAALQLNTASKSQGKES